MEKKSENTRLFEFEEERLHNYEELCVVGDLHGDYTALCSLLDLVDLEKSGLIFLGDYADRGDFGVEVIEAVSHLINSYPGNVVALKGNHEEYTDSGQPNFHPCDLIDEAHRKRGDWRRYFRHEFKRFASTLHLAAVIPGEILFVHGGISSKITSLDDLKHPTLDIEKAVLWSDPFSGTGEHPNKRGAGVIFGENITMEVCRRIGVKRIVRSHEPMKALRAPFYEHGGKVITISSTRVYGGAPFILKINAADLSEVTFCLLQDLSSMENF